MKLLEARVIDYDMMGPFILPGFLDNYFFEVEYCWGYSASIAIGVNLFKHWSNISLQ